MNRVKTCDISKKMKYKRNSYLAELEKDWDKAIEFNDLFYLEAFAEYRLRDLRKDELDKLCVADELDKSLERGIYILERKLNFKTKK